MATSDAKYPVPENFMKNHFEEDSKFAFEKYVSLYHACFKPATAPGPYERKSSSYFHKQGVNECKERLERWTTDTVRAGAENGRSDDMLEYGLRLASGTHATRDAEAAYDIFTKIIGDAAQPASARAIAANLTCMLIGRNIQALEKQGSTEAEAADRIDNYGKAFALIEISAMYGLFAWCGLSLIQVQERRLDSERHADKNWLERLGTPNLRKAYDAFREETGIQRMVSNMCSVCDKTVKLKRCGGHCPQEKKPRYCGHACQKMDWPKHRKWCKPEESSADSEGEWTTDSEREDWEYSSEDDF
ncbi:hypothetical protein NLJ89_g5210 [Agrocybe chaxingu]|uniref:MYND-type domain-containing protein n=1 Tax=Agrocybe chaxingu TaxID=84603 RepID=A0A9W8MX34_9AGAR|nr:hypothetical protein NLJ89_g5210 [Agrocybe chaxingu]